MSDFILLISCFVFLGSVQGGEILWNLKLLDKKRNNSMVFSQMGWNHGFQGDLKFICCSQNAERPTVVAYISCPSYIVFQSVVYQSSSSNAVVSLLFLQPVIANCRHLAQHLLGVETNPAKCQNKLDLKIQAFCDFRCWSMNTNFLCCRLGESVGLLCFIELYEK